MLDILVMIVKMDQVNIFGQMATNTREIFVKICDKVKDKCIGMMAVLILANGNVAFLTEKVVMYLTKLGIFKVKG
jgi:hypothetical protein